MNNSALVIAAVTATLKNLLSRALSDQGATVTACPLAKARPDMHVTSKQLNLCLYQTTINAALRNNPEALHRPPVRAADGSLILPLPLNLYYLITAYGDGSNAEIASHAILGQAMSLLHDHPVLSKQDIVDISNNNQTGIDLSDNGLSGQIEGVRITPQPLSEDDMMKLWTAAQTGYSPSFAYQVSVVLIESSRIGSVAQPVLRRGPDDSGPKVDAGSLGPEITRISIPNGRRAAFAADIVKIEGTGFEADPAGKVRVLLAPDIGNPGEVEPGPESTAEMVALPLNAVGTAPGAYAVAITVDRKVGNELRKFTSNALPLVLVRQVTHLKLKDQLVATTAPDSERVVERSGNHVRIGIVCAPPLQAKETQPGSFELLEKVTLLFQRATTSAVSVDPEPLTSAGPFGTATQPLFFTLSVPGAQDVIPATLTLRSSAGDLPSIVPGPEGLGFSTTVRIRKEPRNDAPLS